MYISHLHPPKGLILENMGGMQRVSMQLVGELKKRTDVQLDTITLEAPWKMTGPKTAWFLINQLFNLPVKVKQYRPDVILFSSMVTASLSYFIRNKVDLPMVTINHGQDVTLPVPAYQKFIPKVFDSLDGVISVSNATREQCILRGMNPEKGVAIPNGFPFHKIDNHISKKESRRYLEETFGIDISDKYLLVTVGRQVRRKGHQWFLENVFPKINSEVIYLVVGDGPEHERIQQAAQKSPKRDQIVLLGRQDDEVLKHTYAGADLFIMPNIKVPGDMEGFGIVLLEANERGTPAVVSDLEGIKDVIKNGTNGYRIEPGNSKDFAQKIDLVLNNELNTLSEQCRSYVFNNFSWTEIVNRYLEFLRTVIARYPASNKLAIATKFD